jgi:hypothetical protein
MPSLHRFHSPNPQSITVDNVSTADTRHSPVHQPGSQGRRWLYDTTKIRFFWRRQYRLQRDHHWGHTCDDYLVPQAAYRLALRRLPRLSEPCLWCLRRRVAVLCVRFALWRMAGARCCCVAALGRRRGGGLYVGKGRQVYPRERSSLMPRHVP